MIDRLVLNNGGDIEQLNFVPSLMKNGQFAVILDAHSGEVVAKLSIDPWLN